MVSMVGLYDRAAGRSGLFWVWTLHIVGSGGGV